MKTLSNTSMKPSLLQRHLQTNHPEKKDLDPNYLSNLEKVRKTTTRQHREAISTISWNGNSLLRNSTFCGEKQKATYNRRVHYICSESVGVGSNRFKQVQAALKLNNVSLSNNTIQRRITEMSPDINKLVSMEKYGFAIQLDKTADEPKCAQLLLVFVRYATQNSIRSELLLSNESSTTTRAEDIFELVDNFFKENSLQWNKLVGCTTDDVSAMLGRKSGFKLV